VKVCVYGAGAIGAYLAAALTDGGAEVTLIARGPHLAAMQKNGLTLIEDGESRTLKLPCSDDPTTLGAQDYVILTVKAHSVAPAVDQIKTLLGPETAVVTAQNGILWWYCYAVEGPLRDQRLETADPGGVIWDALRPERAIGCVVYPSCEIVEPGVVKHLDGKRFMLGEPGGDKTERVTALAEAMTAGGLKAPVRKKIRDDIWFKLLGNATFYPVSVLTGATLEQMGTHPGVRSVIKSLMAEAAAVATRLGVRFAMDLDQRIDGATAVGAHKTSMLQDFELGRPLEIDALVASVTELGRLVEVPTPVLDAAVELVRYQADSRG
jgi:2-dehydropantoate 2-reductase